MRLCGLEVSFCILPTLVLAIATLRFHFVDVQLLDTFVLVSLASRGVSVSIWWIMPRWYAGFCSTRARCGSGAECLEDKLTFDLPLVARRGTFPRDEDHIRFDSDGEKIAWVAPLLLFAEVIIHVRGSLSLL